ncbi:DUF4373 domain-containing protein [Bacteroides graminisolvens]|uniref:Lin1244/Lin1753-like N-terminal domain-containing protein n=1 Tax=Bacteroides graminisolvens DSM 19988 = JCM 15093 TaxID=1121097 RepID=A0A069D2Y1_9BACE|nr:DUF4373 domain-containing protein [Bacteroides graminisolvens]GAK37268.1 hypothetical protein JCM15093_2506 [Bacteroides graminisolvens DSM 19988 = JCM 15093]
MARPQKDGLDYFPFDVDFMKDTKVRRIARTFGCTGTMAIVMLFTDIYRTRGYYMNWDEDTCFDLSETLQCDPELAAKIVDACVLAKIFNVDLFQDKAVLTSAAIQLRYLKINQDCKRQRTINPELSLIELPQEAPQPPAEKPKRKGRKRAASDEVPPNAPSEAVTSEGMPQRKQEETRGNQNKGENSTANQNELKQTTEEHSTADEIARCGITAAGCLPPQSVAGNRGEPAVVSNGLSSASADFIFSSPSGESIREEFSGAYKPAGFGGGNSEAALPTGALNMNDDPQSSDANGTLPAALLNSLRGAPPHDEGTYLRAVARVREVMNMLEVTDEKSVSAICEMCRRTELGGIGGLVWRILNFSYLPELKRKERPAVYVLWAFNHPELFMDTYEKYIRKIQRKNGKL